MNQIIDFVTNPFIVTGVSSWMIAQIIKFIINIIINKECDPKKLFSSGGMPSGHCATVCSVAFLSALRYGTGSFQFAISLIFCFIVCHDAMGVRRETGKQAVVINNMADFFKELSSDKLPEVKLKDSVGHTPLQVTMGILLGIVNACVMYYIFF